MISNTDSTLFVYSTEHMLVKVYKAGIGMVKSLAAGLGFGDLRHQAIAELGRERIRVTPLGEEGYNNPLLCVFRGSGWSY